MTLLLFSVLIDYKLRIYFKILAVTSSPICFEVHAFQSRISFDLFLWVDDVKRDTMINN